MSDTATITVASKQTTVMAVATVHSIFLPAIFITAQVPIRGALMIACIPIMISICTCVTSLVVLVIRLAVENF